MLMLPFIGNGILPLARVGRAAVGGQRPTDISYAVEELIFAWQAEIGSTARSS